MTERNNLGLGDRKYPGEPKFARVLYFTSTNKKPTLNNILSLLSSVDLWFE